MKKVILTCLAAFSIISANAENVLAIVPTKVTPGTEATLAVNMNNEFQVYTIGIEITLPKGMTFKGGGRNGDAWTNGTTTILNAERTEYAFDAANKGNIIKNADGTQTLRLGCTGSDYVDGESGKLFDVKIVVDASVAPGVYPIVAEGVEIYDQSVHGVSLESHTSYIVVGDPTDATLALSGIVPSFVNEALASETAIANLDLSGATALNGEVAYTVGRALTVPAVPADVKVVAGLNGGTYGSLCSPVALPGVKCYTFTSAADGIATFTEVDNVPANEVVIIDAAVNAKVAGASLVSVANGTADAGRLYVAPDGSELRRAKNSVTVPALRGTWDIAGGSNLRIALDTPTGIKMIGTANEVFGNTYDLQGRQVENAQNGVYVVNGKKQFVK